MAHPGIHAQTHPDRPAVIMVGSGDQLTYRELDEQANQLAHLLWDQGLRRGDHVALFMENQIRFMVVAWAAFRSGLHLTAINSYLTTPEVEYILDDCDARVLVTSSAKWEVASGIDPAAAPRVERWLVTDQPDLTSVSRSEGASAPWEHYENVTGSQPLGPIADPSPGRAMLYSSGTTGRPKGVRAPLPEHPVDELDPRTVLSMQGRFGYHADMVYLSPAPMYHAAPLAFSTPVHRLGGTLVIMEKFEPARALEAIEVHGVTHSQWVPTMFVRMLKLPDEVRSRYDLSSLDVAIHAAAPCPIPVKRQMIEWWGPCLLEYYAGTEGNGATFIDSADWLEHPGSVGRAPAGMIHICDPEGNDLPPGAEGGVYFSGGGTFEYHKDAEKTAAATLPGGRTTLGDIGYLDEDGYLYLTDRKAHMIISGGVNIYPREIEDLLVTHPSVADVAVFGVPDPDMGEQVKAVVQPAPEALAGSDLADELISFCREHLAHYKCPKTVDFEDELPRLPTGKLYKRILRDRYWGKTDSTIV